MMILSDTLKLFLNITARVMKDPKTEFACQYIGDIGLLQGVPEMLEQYFDYEAFGKDMFLGDYSEYEGHIFLDM
jgi:antirestriction protein